MNVKWVTDNCRRWQEDISLQAAALLKESEKRALEIHLTDCAQCREYAQDLTILSRHIAGLKEDAREAVPSGKLRARWTEQVMGRPRSTARDLEREGRPAVFARWWDAIRGRGLAWGFAAAACAALVFTVGYWRVGGRNIASANLLQNTEWIRETLAMFPNRVRAITQDDQGLKLVLSDSDSVPASSPLYLRVCDGGHCVAIVTFSGQDIQVAGQKISVLADAQGKMILVGENFVWSEKEKVRGDTPLKIEARNLGTVLL